MSTRRPTSVVALVLSVAAGVGLAGCAPAFDRSVEGSPSPAEATPTGPRPTPVGVTTPAAAPSSSARPPVVVVLDPGHNGGNAGAPSVIDRLVPAGGYLKPCNTTGTSTNAGYPEHAFTFDVARRTAALLEARGLRVVLTRSDDGGVGPCVDRRAAIANASGAALAVSIHADGAAAGVRGFHVIEPAAAPDGGNGGILDASAVAAADLRQAFGAATEEPPATYPGALVEPGLTRRNDLAGLNLARVPAVMIECANMRNAQDAAEVNAAAWRQRAAQGIAAGITAYVGSR